MNNKLYILVFLILFVKSGRLFSQSTITSAYIEKKTYELYTQKKWNELIKTGKGALKNDIDYFFLRTKIGIAYYEKRNYSKAIKHLKKALKCNSADNTVLEYLYYSYLFLGRNQDAKVLASHFPSYLKEKIGYKKGGLNNIMLEGGYSLSDNEALNGNIDLDGDDNKLGENDLSNEIIYVNLGLNHSLGKRINVLHSYTNLTIFKTKQIQENNIKTSNNYNLNQHEYYINPEILLAKGLRFSPAFHFLYVKYTTIYKNDNFDFGNKVKYPLQTTTLSDYAVSATLSKEFSKFKLGINGTYSSLNNENPIQAGVILTCFPLGNLNLYTNTSVIEHIQGTESNIIVEQMIGSKVFNKMWIEGSVTIGDLYNYCEKNAFIVYNVTDKIKSKCGVSLLFPISEKFEFYIQYQNIQKESSYETDVKELNTITYKTEKRITNYSNNLIIGGLKWNL